MKIFDNRNTRRASIGDILITNEGNRYMLLNNYADGEKISVYNIDADKIEFDTIQKVFVVDGSLRNEDIIEIVSKDNVTLVIE